MTEPLIAYIRPRRWGQELELVTEADEGFDVRDARWTVPPELVGRLRAAQRELRLAENAILDHMRTTGQPSLDLMADE